MASLDPSLPCSRTHLPQDVVQPPDAPVQLPMLVSAPVLQLRDGALQAVRCPLQLRQLPAHVLQHAQQVVRVLLHRALHRRHRVLALIRISCRALLLAMEGLAD